MHRKSDGCLVLIVALLTVSSALAQQKISTLNCEDPYSLCTERQYNKSLEPGYNGRYIGHDEPSLLFYSDDRGSGNYNVYRMVLPKDPPAFPTDANSSGTGDPTVWNFQLHPAFWFGMALCDSESFPLYNRRCKPDSDSNIFDDPNPHSEKFIGHHPGTAFLELQFYPPGWVSGYSPTQYTVALHINSYNVKALGQKGPILNNTACQNSVGLEPTIFALLTLNGKSQAPADPLNSDPAKFAVLPGETLVMNPGDSLVVTIRDTEEGLSTTVEDVTTGVSGSMTASVVNGFAQVVFDADATTCTTRPYAYHPMYATSSEHTRVPWAAHTYNVAFADEIGHYNYCDTQDNSIIPGLGACVKSPVEAEADPKTGLHSEIDDFFCVDSASAIGFGSLGPLGGCLDSDIDFDGIPYHHAWPGSGRDPYGFSAVPEPIRFTSPKFKSGEDEKDMRSYSRVAFEADMPIIEDSTVCNVSTGAGCTNPPPAALFYPIFTTTSTDDHCWWQLGGASIPDTTNTFGGTSTAEYGKLLGSLYEGGTLSKPGARFVFTNYRQVLPHNPCL